MPRWHFSERRPVGQGVSGKGISVLRGSGVSGDRASARNGGSGQDGDHGQKGQ